MHDPIEIEALLLRKEAVMSQAVALGFAGNGLETDGVGMLIEILFPSEAFLAASLKQAAIVGPSPLAKRVAKLEANEGKEKKKPKRTKVTLDEILVEFESID